MASKKNAPFRIGRAKTGLGLFATAPIAKKQFIVEYKGPRISTAVADELNNKYLFEINTRWTIDGAGRRNVARYINHGCRPNAESDVIKGKVIIRSIRKIAEGDEITYDYGKNYFDTFIKPHGCRCASCVAKAKVARAEKRAAARAAKLRAERKLAKLANSKTPAKTATKAKVSKTKVSKVKTGKTKVAKATPTKPKVVRTKPAAREPDTFSLPNRRAA
jgi:hypothetical protein